ncbi:hypothetical protein [Chamaesiphon polymorphus]|uniref:Uncharacterized protein n=1 Tax=Chamaesiphon polymorphus CCALA 037 TaxID=2107692 RepID=A0A2T1FRL5_9CYAN|nr:hypothetical protein [Chamaesiphon polymorphus]PSB47632.1 hypothetical protein C7B77_24240 [Chamaesiphon polymorphus CCALA 037]
MKLTRYSLFAEKTQTDRVTDLPAYREIAGETLLDHFLGDERLYLAQNNDFITQDEIDRNAPEGTELLLVDRDDLIYGSSEAKAKLKAVLPIDYLAGAYASVFKGGCDRVKLDRPLRVAVVDFKDYDSGNANIPAELSRQFVHDSCGAIDTALLKDATGKENAIQFRLGLTGDAPTFAKGMLNPIDLQSLFPPGEAPDAILSSDSFKGNKVAPGWYEYAPQELFLGIKNDSLRTDSSISEVVSIYPETAADVLPIVHARARTLAANSRDIVTMAAQALNDYYLDITDEATADRQDEFNTAKLIEMALTSGRYNLLDSAQVRDWLEDRINASWKNLSCADIPELNSYNSTVLPTWDLKYGEVCVPYLPDGEELTFWRSPIVNRTGIVTVKNNLKAWENLQKLGADPNIIYVNVQTLDRIEAEDPTTYARLLAEYGSKARLESEFQTLMELTQMDFDGDTANVIERSRLPELYAAAHSNQHPDRKLANFHKSEKNLPVDWTLAQIAEHIRPNYVGVVYSHKKAIELSRAEIELAIDRDDRQLMDILAAEYFQKTQKMIYKAASGDLLGRSIAAFQQLKQVKLPPEVAASAQTFIDAFPEREILELYGDSGFKFVVGKMVRFRASLSFIANNHPPTDKNYLEFTTPDGKTKRKISAKLLEAIGDFQKLPLRSLLGKDIEAGKLDLYLTQYEKLCALLRKEIDPNHSIVLHGENRQFDRQTNLFTTVEFSESQQLEAIAALPSTDLPARLRLYQKVLDAGITATSQLNQDAVDVFKSANIIHDENSQVLARELARDRFASVSGKTRSSAYRDGNLPQPNGIAAPHLIQELCNQNYEIPFRGKQETSNPDLIASFRDIPVSATAAAIARFYLSDDREIIDKYKQSSRIEAINGGRKTYLELKLGRGDVKIFALDPQIFKDFLQRNDPIHFDFTEKVAKVGDAPLGKLDPVACQQLANKYPQGLELDRQNFEALRIAGNIDLVATHDDRRAITAERRANLDRLRAAFALDRIEPLEALAAIAQATKGARTGYLVAAYPDALLAHIQASTVDNLILDDGVALVGVGDSLPLGTASPLANRARQQLGTTEFDFCVDDRGTLVTSAGAELKFLRDRPMAGDYRIDNRIRASSHLKPGTVGTGRLVAEAYLYSLGMAGNKRAIVNNLTEAGKQISAQISATELTLDPVKSLPYTINVMGMECPIRAASEGLVDLWGRIARSMAVEFKQFRYNPLDPSTGKPSFTAGF